VRWHDISVNFRLGDVFRAWGGFRADLHGGFPPVRTKPTILDIKHWASVLASASCLPAFHPRGTCLPANTLLARKSPKNQPYSGTVLTKRRGWHGSLGKHVIAIKQGSFREEPLAERVPISTSKPTRHRSRHVHGTSNR